MNLPVRYRIAFSHAQWFKDIEAQMVGSPEPEAIADAYAETVRTTLEPLVKAGKLEAQRRGPSYVGGGGLFIDWVDVFLKAGAALAIMRQAAKDIRKAAAEVAKRTGRQAYIDENAAVILAATEWLALGAKDVELVSAIPLEQESEQRIGAPPSAFVVTLTVDGTNRLTVVKADGTIVGSTTEHPFTFPDPTRFAEWEFGLGGIGTRTKTPRRKKAGAEKRGAGSER